MSLMSLNITGVYLRVLPSFPPPYCTKTSLFAFCFFFFCITPSKPALGLRSDIFSWGSLCHTFARQCPELLFGQSPRSRQCVFRVGLPHTFVFFLEGLRFAMATPFPVVVLFRPILCFYSFAREVTCIYWHTCLSVSRVHLSNPTPPLSLSLKQWRVPGCRHASCSSRSSQTVQYAY